jgi:hypothetical protein
MRTLWVRGRTDDVYGGDVAASDDFGRLRRVSEVHPPAAGGGAAEAVAHQLSSQHLAELEA